MNKIYSAIDISKFIINYSNEKGYTINNSVLQKLLYFVQVRFVSYKGKICFGERLIAKPFGPIVKSSFKEFLNFNVHIYPVEKFDENIILKDDREEIKLVVDFFSEYMSVQMMNIINGQPPYVHGLLKMDKTIEITDILNYFK